MGAKETRRMGVSPLNAGLLESTLTPEDQASDNPKTTQAPQEPSAPSLDSMLDVKPRSNETKKSVQKPKVTVNSLPIQIKPKDQTEQTSRENPFGYDIALKWPIIDFDMPYLIPVTELESKASSSMSLRLPLPLCLTVESHCRKLGIKNVSQWVRRALEMQLSQEQQKLSHS